MATHLEKTLFLILPEEIYSSQFVFLENKNGPVHLSIKRFDPELYKIFWIGTIRSFSMSKEECKKSILGIHYESKNRNITIDYLKGYGDLNMYISRSINKSLNFDELLMNSEKENIFDYITVNQDVSFFTFNCSTDSYLTIDLNHQQYITSLSGLIYYIEKGRTQRFTLFKNVSYEFDYNITIINKFDNQLEDGDVIINSVSQSISMIEKSILFHHNKGEDYLEIQNLKYDLIFNISIQLEIKFNYYFNDTFTNLTISGEQMSRMLIKPKILETAIPRYIKLYHNIHAKCRYNSIYFVILSLNYLRDFVDCSYKEEIQFSLDNEVVKNHFILYPTNPFYFWFYLENVYNANYTFDYYYSGLADLKKGKIFHSNDSRIVETLFELDPKEENTDMISFQIFLCENENRIPDLTIKYNSKELISDYKFDYGEDNHLFLLKYNINNIKGEGYFKGNFIIYYNLYKNQSTEMKKNINYKLEFLDYNIIEKKIKINIYPYLFDEEINYEIFYSKNDLTSLLELSRCEALLMKENFLTNENENIKHFQTNYTASKNTPFIVEIDYSEENWIETNFYLDFIIFAKQIDNQKSIDVYIDQAKILYKYNISLDIPFEGIFKIYDDFFFLYDAYTDIKLKKFFYYIYFTQNISLDEINLLCSISTEDSIREYPDLEKNDCNIFQDPDSNNSFILVILENYTRHNSIYNTITIQKKNNFSNIINFTIIKKYFESENISYGVHKKIIDNSFPLLFEFDFKNEIFRLLNKTFNFYYVNTNISNIDEETLFQKDNSLVIGSNITTKTIIISIKNLKIGDIISFEYWRIDNFCQNSTPIVLVNEDISSIIYSNENIVQFNIYDDQYRNRVINLKNIYYETNETNYYIINEENIEDKESIKNQCLLKKNNYLLNDRYIKSNTSYDVIYSIDSTNSIDSFNYFFEENNTNLYYNAEYRVLIYKNHISEFKFEDINYNYNIKIKQFSKSDLIVSTDNNIYNLGIDKNILEFEHQIGEKSIKFENTGKGEDSYIIITLSPKEFDNKINFIEWNTNQKINESEYFLVKLDKNNNDMKLAVFIWDLTNESYYAYSFIILDSKNKYLPNNTLFNDKNTKGILLNNINYDDLEDNENYYLYFKNMYDKDNIISVFVGNNIYSADLEDIIKINENETNLIEFKSNPKIIQIIPCNSSIVNLYMFSDSNITEYNITNIITHSYDSRYLNVSGNSYIIGFDKSIELNDNYSTSIEILDYNETHIKINFLNYLNYTGKNSSFEIVQFNSNSKILNDQCKAYDLYEQNNSLEYKRLETLCTNYENIDQFIDKKKLNQNDFYFNVIGNISQHFYIFYQPIKIDDIDYSYINNKNKDEPNESKDNESSNSLKLILAIAIPLGIIILVFIVFLLYRKYNKSKDEKMINNIKNIESMEKELL